MSDRKVIIFKLSDVNAEDRLIREYIVPAFRRLEGRGDIRWLIFNRYGADPSVNGGEVTFSLFGRGVETVAAAETERWDALVEDGLINEWWVDDTEVRIAEFDDDELLHHRMRAVASRMSAAVFEEFDDLPDAISEFDGGDETFGTGWWLALHYHINQLGYQATDGEEEIDLLFETLRNRLYALTVGIDVSRTEAKIDELVDELESLRPDLRQYRDEHGEHDHRYAARETAGEGQETNF